MREIVHFYTEMQKDKLSPQFLDELKIIRSLNG